MIPSLAKTSPLVSNYDAESTAFGLEVNSSVFNMLTSDIYSYPHEAVLREWSTNAVDACVAADKPVVFDVQLPTVADPVFSVRDYGTGLSPEHLTTLFTKLGASTKRDSNQFNGTLGIGRLAALATSDFFTVVSYFNGVQYGYMVTFKDGLPFITSTHTGETAEPNGLHLSVPVETAAIPQFKGIASKVYSFFEHKPNFVGAIDSIPFYVPLLETDEWASTKFSSQECDIEAPFSKTATYVLMSNVVYQVPVSFNINDLDRPDISHSGPILPNVIFKAKPGEVSFNPGREVLVLDEKTTEFLYQKIKAFHENILIDYSSSLLSLPTDMDRLQLIYELSFSINFHLSKPFDFVTPTFEYLDALASPSYSNSSILGLECDKNSSFPFATSILGRYGTKTAYREIHPAEFVQAKHYIVDFPTGYSGMQRQIAVSNSAIFWLPKKGSAFQENLENLKNYLTNAGIPFQTFSSLFPQEEKKLVKKSSSKAITLFLVPNSFAPRALETYSFLESLEETLSSSENYAILPMVRNSFIEKDTEKTESFIKLFHYLYPQAPVYGLRKTEMAAFGFDYSQHDLYKKVKDALLTTPIRVDKPEYADFVSLYYSTRRLSLLEESSSRPPFLEEAMTILEDLHNYCRVSTTIHPSILQYLKNSTYTLEEFSPQTLDRLSTIVSNHPVTFGVVDDPYRLDRKILDIAALEQFYRDHANDD